MPILTSHLSKSLDTGKVALENLGPGLITGAA
jgi:hypothetical protein